MKNTSYLYLSVTLVLAVTLVALVTVVTLVIVTELPSYRVTGAPLFSSVPLNYLFIFAPASPTCTVRPPAEEDGWRSPAQGRPPLRLSPPGGLTVKGVKRSPARTLREVGYDGPA